MSDVKSKIEQALKVVASNVTLSPIEGCVDSYMAQGIMPRPGFPVALVYTEKVVMLLIGWGNVPQSNIAILYRKMLCLNDTLLHCRLAITDSVNQLRLECRCPIEHFDAMRLMSMLNNLTTTYDQHVVQLVTEFQIQ